LAEAVGCNTASSIELRRVRFSHLIKTEVFGQDRIGTPVRQNAEYHSIDTARAAMFRRISQTRLGDLVLLQLDYSIWFPSRPCTSGFDLLCGHLDGITWRVTLLPDGKPWLQKCRGLVLHFAQLQKCRGLVLHFAQLLVSMIWDTGLLLHGCLG